MNECILWELDTEVYINTVEPTRYLLENYHHFNPDES